MFRSLFAALLLAIFSAPSAQINGKHAARFESLIITAKAIKRDESTLYEDGTHFVTVYVTLMNLGELSVCASPVLVMLKMMDGPEYGQTMLLVGPPRPFAKEPRTWEILPGEKTSGG